MRFDIEWYRAYRWAGALCMPPPLPRSASPPAFSEESRRGLVGCCVWQPRVILQIKQCHEKRAVVASRGMRHCRCVLPAVTRHKHGIITGSLQRTVSTMTHKKCFLCAYKPVHQYSANVPERQVGRGGRHRARWAVEVQQTAVARQSGPSGGAPGTALKRSSCEHHGRSFHAYMCASHTRVSRSQVAD